MKFLKSILFVIFSVLIFSCQKKPTANFNFDRQEYVSGDTILLKNESTDAYSYEWRMPNGTIQTTNDAYYVIPENSGFSTLSFSLKAFSKNRNKSAITNNVTKTIPQSSFSIIGSQTFYPTDITSSIWPQGPSYWNVTAKMKGSTTKINFTLTDYPTVNKPLDLWIDRESNWNYSAVDWANFQFQLHSNTGYYLYNSLSGMLHTEIINGKLHLKMDSVAIENSSIKISANIYCH